MNSIKNKIFNIYKKAIWLIIIVLCIYITYKGCMLFSENNTNKTYREFAQTVSSTIRKQIVWSSSPLFQYVQSKKNQSTIISEKINAAFPISKYMKQAWLQNVEEENEGFENYKDAVDYEQLFANEDEFASDEDTTYKFGDGEVGFINGESYIEENKKIVDQDDKEVMANNMSKIMRLENEKDFHYLINNFYIVDSSTKVNSKLFAPEKLLGKDMTMKQNNKKPQILIYHTHSQEAFADSRKGEKSDTVVGVGETLKKHLEEQYGYNVIHDTGEYDLVNGVLDRSKAYTYSLMAVEKILKENPSIEVVIDLHRDGVNRKTKDIAIVNGKETAQVMFFNGLSISRNGPIEYLENKNIEGNLAFSLQLQLQSLSKYPDFTKKIYLKSYRYNLHLRAKSLLIELGNQNSSVKDAKNAMEPLADILNSILKGE